MNVVMRLATFTVSIAAACAALAQSYAPPPPIAPAATSAPPDLRRLRTDSAPSSGMATPRAGNVPKLSPMEIYPPHLAAAMDRFRAGTLPGLLSNSRELQGVFNRTKLWTAGQVLGVCFFDGASLDVRTRIANLAKQWEKAANVSLYFGRAATMRSCNNATETSEIRIGFGYKGYWSLLGQDSVNLSPQSDQSMNLEYYNSAPPEEPEFSRVVLHEFGHALGLVHEHQNPNADCQNEFDWPEIYKYLALPPNGWDKEKVDFNMGRLINDGEIKTVGTFDKLSIMLYRFDTWMYKNGADSKCFPGHGSAISPGDLATVAAMYPKDLAAARSTRDRDVARLRKALSDQQGRLDDSAVKRSSENLDLLSSPPAYNKREQIERLNATK